MLQQIEVSATFFPKGVTDKGFLIESESDFCTYFDIEEKKLMNDFKSALKSNMSTSQWDHIHGSLGVGTSIAKVNGGIPIVEATKMLNQKQSNIFRMLGEGKSIFINRNGGYQEFKDETHTIITKSEFKYDKMEHVVFSDKPSLINFENDPDLEKRTIEYFKESNLELSHIVQLREFSKSELIDILNKFSEKGGHGVYVYTTASDVPQMIDYIDAIINSKLNTLILEINAEISNEALKAIEFAKKNIKYFELK